MKMNNNKFNFHRFDFSNPCEKQRQISSTNVGLIEPSSNSMKPIPNFNKNLASNQFYYNNFEQLELKDGCDSKMSTDRGFEQMQSKKDIKKNSFCWNCKKFLSKNLTSVVTNDESKFSKSGPKGEYSEETFLISILDEKGGGKPKRRINGLPTKDLIEITKRRKKMIENAKLLKNGGDFEHETKNVLKEDDAVQTSFIFQDNSVSKNYFDRDIDFKFCDSINDNANFISKDELDFREKEFSHVMSHENNGGNESSLFEKDRGPVRNKEDESIVNLTYHEGTSDIKKPLEEKDQTDDNEYEIEKVEEVNDTPRVALNKSNYTSNTDFQIECNDHSREEPEKTLDISGNDIQKDFDNNLETSSSRENEESYIEEVDYNKYQQQNETKIIDSSNFQSSRLNGTPNNNNTLKKLSFFDDTLSRVKKVPSNDKINLDLKITNFRRNSKQSHGKNFFASNRYEGNINIPNTVKNEPKKILPSSSTTKVMMKYTQIEKDPKKGGHKRTNSCYEEKEHKCKTPIRTRKKSRHLSNYSDIYKSRTKQKRTDDSMISVGNNRHLNRSMEVTEIINNSILTNRNQKNRRHNQSTIN